MLLVRKTQTNQRVCRNFRDLSLIDIRRSCSVLPSASALVGTHAAFLTASVEIKPGRQFVFFSSYREYSTMRRNRKRLVVDLLNFEYPPTFCLSAFILIDSMHVVHSRGIEVCAIVGSLSVYLDEEILRVHQSARARTFRACFIAFGCV